MAMAYSDTDVALAPRAEHTSMPRRSHSATSMLSSPTPSRPTTFSFGAISSSALSTGVRLRTIRPGRSRTSFSSSARLFHSSRSQCTLKSFFRTSMAPGSRNSVMTMSVMHVSNTALGCLHPLPQGAPTDSPSLPCGEGLGVGVYNLLPRHTTPHPARRAEARRATLPVKGRVRTERDRSLELQPLAHVGEHLWPAAPCRCPASRAGVV